MGGVFGVYDVCWCGVEICMIFVGGLRDHCGENGV